MAKTEVPAKLPRNHRIILLRDADGDNGAETPTTLLERLHSPVGRVLVGTDFYVANADGRVRRLRDGLQPAA